MGRLVSSRACSVVFPTMKGGQIRGDARVLTDTAATWIKAVGTEVGKVAPGAIQGALTGFMAGGPAGAAIGAVGGGANAYMKGSAGAQASPVIAQQPNAAAIQLLAAILRRK
jgi:hypothetical protein